MSLEVIFLTAAAAAIVLFGLYRRRHRVFHEEKHHESIVCVVRFHDRGETLPRIESFFEQEYITVRDLKREMKRVDGQDLFINTYSLGMPKRVDQGRLVGYLSSIRTVVSVQIHPK